MVIPASVVVILAMTLIVIAAKLSSPFLAASAAASGFAASLWLHSLFRSNGIPRFGFAVLVALGSVLVVLGIVVLLIFILNEEPELAAAGMTLIVLGYACLRGALGERRWFGGWGSILLASFGVLGTYVSLLLPLGGLLRTLLVVGCLALIALGLLFFERGIAARCSPIVVLFLVASGILLTNFVAARNLIRLGPVGILLALVGVVLFLLGMLGATKILLALLKNLNGKAFRMWALVGTVSLLGSVALFFSRGGFGLVSLAALIIVVTIGISFVTRDESYLLLFVVAFFAVWVSVDRTAPAPNIEANTNGGRILALGDSYTSGEGADLFLEGTNEPGVNECRRSPTAYPVLLADELDMGLDFYACSGAITEDVYDTKPHDPENLAQMPNSPPDVPGQKFQLDNIEPGDLESIEVVLISIGGNDVGFGEIGKSCALPGSCTAFRHRWMAEVVRVGPAIEATFNEVKQAVRVKEAVRDVPIIAVPYPLSIQEDPLLTQGCDSPLTREEQAFLAEFIAVLNDRIRWAAARAGVHFFEDGLFVFPDGKICDPGWPDAAAMNLLNVTPTEGGPFTRLSPRNWLHGSFHPNRHGHELLAEKLREYIEEWELLKPDAGNPTPDPDANFDFRRVRTDRTVLSNLIEVPGATDIQKECPVDDVSPFAVLRTSDEDSGMEELDTVSGSTVCYTLADGSWTTSLASQEAGPVQVERLVPAHGTRQWIVFQDAHDEIWRQLILEFCSKIRSCSQDPVEWGLGQAIETVGDWTPSITLVLVSSWLAACVARRYRRKS